ITFDKQQKKKTTKKKYSKVYLRIESGLRNESLVFEMGVWSSKWESGPKKRRGDERKGEKRRKERRKGEKRMKEKGRKERKKRGKEEGDKGNHNQDDPFFDQIG